MRIGMAIDLVPGFGAFTSGSALLDGSESDGTNILLGGVGLTSNWTTQNASLTTAVTTAPDGTTTAALLTENSGTSRHIAFQFDPSATTSDGAFTLSLYCKSNGRRYVQIIPSGYGGAQKAYVYADLQTGTITGSGGISGGSVSSSSIEAAVNSFWKVTMEVSGFNTSEQPYIVIALSDVADYGSPLDSDSPSYTGDGTSGVYLWRPKMVD